MKFKSVLSAIIASAMLVSMAGCSDNGKKNNTQKPANMPDPSDKISVEINKDLDIPDEYLEPMSKLLSEWGIRKGSLSDPLIGTRILMYEKTKDEVGFLLADLDGNGINELITAPFDGYKENGLVYDILTIKDGKAFHLANSLQATYHFCDDYTFVLRIPQEDKSFKFKNVVIIGDEKPIETDITKEEAATFVLATNELTPFSALEK